MQFTRIWAGKQVAKTFLKTGRDSAVKVTFSLSSRLLFMKPKITDNRYVLAVKNLARSVEFYYAYYVILGG
jgi:hypothetical protein